MIPKNCQKALNAFSLGFQLRPNASIWNMFQFRPKYQYLIPLANDISQSWPCINAKAGPLHY